MLIEKTERFVDRKVEHFCDISAAQFNRLDVSLKTAAIASLAFHLQVGHEMHLDRYSACTMAFFTAPAVDVERKVSRLDAQPPSFRAGCEQPANLIIDLEVGCWIRAQRT